MDSHIETIARCTGEIVAILALMNERYPEFRSLLSFKIALSNGDELNGANIGSDVDGNDLTDLLINIQEAYASQEGDGMDFEIELNVMINKLKEGLEGNGEEE